MNLQNIEAIYPLSPFQAALLSGDLRAIDRSAYCGQMICSLHGQLDTAAFERAWRLIIDEHPILRTMFAWENLEKPVQLVHRQIDFSLLQHDWRGLSLEQQQELLDTLLEAERETGFHATQAPLMRLCLCRLTGDDYYLLWSYDLLVLDNWSLPLLLEKATAVYEGQLKGEIPQVEQGRLYQDYIAWLTQQDLTRAEAFWKESLNGLNGSDNLNGLFRSTHETANGYAHIQLPFGLTASLRSFASEHQLDFQALVQGAWALLLSRYSGENEIVYGATVSGRPADLTGASLMIGPFSNVLPVHVRVSSSTPVVSWLKSLSAHLDDLRKYSFYPVTRWSGNNGGASHLPAFVSTVQTESSPTNGVLHENGASLHVRQIQTVGQTKSPLMLIAPSQSEATLQLGYNPAAFDDASAARLTQHFENLLTGILQQPQLPISQLSILSAPELDQLLYSFNDTAGPLPQTSIHARFQQQVLQSPEAVAVVFEGEQLSYAELDQRANQLAHYLRAHNVARDEIVGILMERSVELVVALLGILKAGAAYLPLDPGYPAERLSFMLADADLRFVISHQAVAAMLPALTSDSSIKVLSLDSEWAQVAAQPRTAPEVRTAADNLAYVLYTSGSTGQPKGVMISQAGLSNHMRWMQEQFPLGASDAVLQKTPFSFDASVWEFWAPLLAGARLVLAQPGGQQDAPYLLEVMEREGVTRLQGVPTLLRMLVKEGGLERCRQLREVCSGGEVLGRELAESLLRAHSAVRLYNFYGPTETTIEVTWQEAERARVYAGEEVSIGRPITNTQVYVLDGEMQLAPVGVVGELYIGGAGLGRGYLKRPALSAERFVPHPYSAEAGARLYRTGDLVRWLEGGELAYLGRKDGQVKLRGFRVELSEIEVVLRAHALVKECKVLVKADQVGNQQLVGYLILNGRVERQGGSAALRQYLHERLPEYMVPTVFMMLEEWPLTPSGKVDVRALPPPEVKRDKLTGGYVAPATAVEQIVAGIWADLLKVEVVGAQDNFFELGGHSLLATQVISRIRETFKQEISLRSLFGKPTVAEWAATIELAQREGRGLEAPPIVRVPRDGELPLSFAQQRLWFLDQLEPGSSFYNIPAAVRLRGVLNVAALERTLSEVVRRHEALRTHFIAIDGEPVQVIEPAAPLQLEVLELSALEEEAREAEVLRLAQLEASQPFDLGRGPLLRVGLLRLGKEEHVALVTMHHIVSDGWSMGLFIDEVATLYAAYVRGDESPLEELPLQYADFAHWQRGWLQGEVLAAQLAYWRAELADAPTVLELPSDKPRPPIQTYRGANQPLQLSAALSAQVRDLSRRHGATLFMTLLAAFDLLLCRYAGQEQVLVGTPIANRNRSETEGLIGFFVNTLVLRGDVRGNPSFSELLRRVRETALSAYAQQDLPFEKLVEELQPERDLSWSPLFQVMFALQNAPGEVLELPGLTVSSISTGSSAAKFDLGLNLQEFEGCLTGEMDYNVDLFERTTIERLSEHFKTLLQSIVANFERPVAELRLLSEAEERQLLYSFNDTAAPLPQTSIHALFQQQVLQLPDAVALSLVDSSLTYVELDRRSNQLAHHLVALGVSPESLVAVCLDRSLELFIALLGILKAGAAYLPLDPSYPLARLSFMLADAGSPLLLTTESLAGEFPRQWTPRVLLDADWDLIALNPDEALPEKVVAADQLAYVMYTSGSTGTPKGVAVTHGGVVRLVTSPNYVRLDAEQTLLQLAPLTFDASTLEVWGALLNGGRLAVMPPNAPTLDEISRVIVDEGVTTLWLTAGLFHLMVDEQLEGLSQVEQLLAGGDVLSVRHVEKYLATTDSSERRLINGYGPTENTTFTCCHVMEGQTRLNGSVPIGRPVTNTQVYVLDAQMQVAPVGVVGELYIGGAGLARGYFNQPELTAERFVPHPHSMEAGARLYSTGDMVRWHESGALEFIGRVDGQVKVRGFRIEVGEIEAVLAGHEGVREAVVLVREDERGDKRLAAYVVKESEVTAEELTKYLREQLPEYMQVQWVVPVAELPLTANGKVDRRALQALAVESGGGESVQARTPTEEILAAIWAEVLGRETIGVHDNFFELGGHSLLATQVISRVRDAFGREVALRSLFEQPTVAGLAREIEAGRGPGAELQAPPLERVERAERLPLSFAQQRLWFLDQLEPGSSFYNIPAAVRLRGMLNVAALERALSEVVRRHEALRTHFITIDGEPVQVIEAAAPLQLEVLELSALEEEAREAEVLRLAQLEASQPFDLGRGPLLRVGLLRLGKEEHVALVTMHHIVSDGWSMGLFIDEVTTLYKAFTAGEESPLEELPIQYADFAHWQRGWLQGEVLAAQLDYWRAELADAPTVLELPSDKPRPPIQTYRGANQPLQLSAALSAQVRDLSRRHGATLFMTLLAAFDLLLCRYAGQEQVLVGTPIANRNRSETEGLIGFFVNTLVLRGDVRGNPSFSELLRRVRETALSGYAQQDLPFEKLVEELQPERDLSRSPLFQVMFALQNAPGEVLELPGLTVSSISTGSSAAKFDLGLNLQESEGCLTGEMDYNVDLFERTTIERLSEHFKTLLQSIVANFGRPVAELRLLSEAEERQLLYEWNDQPAGFDSDLFIHELFAAQAAQRPKAVAVVFENQQLTYEELNRRANQLAHHLQGFGVGPEVVVGICVERSVEMVVALLGTLKAGAAYLPLDPAYPAERLSFMLADAGVRFIISHQSVEAMLPALLPDSTINVLSLDAEWAKVAAQPATAPGVQVSPENLAYILYTSGSTGQPKGVMISQGAISNHMQWMAEQLPLGASDAVLQKTPFSFDASVWEFWAPLLAGARLVLARPGGHQEAAYLLEVMEREGVTRLQGVPTLLRMLVSEGGLERCKQLREVFSGGEVLGRELAESILQAHSEVKLYNLYGPTEATIDTTWQEAERDRAETSEEVGIGRPITNAQVYVLDAQLQTVPVGVVGELYIGGAGLARGYLNRPTFTAERFVPHPYSEEAGARLYRTGDMVRWLEGGKLAYVGRKDAQVKLRGFRVELSEIEVVLRAHALVKECKVLVKADHVGGQQLVGYILSAHDERQAGGAELREYLRDRLPEYMVPTVFMMLEEWPLTPSGKVDVRALPLPEVKRDKLMGGYLAPATPVQQIVAGIWADLLKVEVVGAQDNFFELGGHSLLATQVISRLRATFKQEISLRSLFAKPTVAGLAQTIEIAQREGHGLEAPPLISVSREEDLPLSFAQQRLWFLDQLEPGNSFYNIPAAVRLRGVLNVAALERTLSEVVRRHEALRTHFIAIDGDEVQVIEPAAPLQLEVLDLSALDEAERTAETERLVTEESGRPFDLASGPLLRVGLLRLGKEEHVALVTMHHIVSDGWSMGLFIDEVATLYAAYVRGDESPLQELPIQYADFAHWQRGWLQGEVLAAQLAYWRAELADAPTVLELPSDKPRPPIQTYRGANQPLQLSAALSAQVRDLSRRHGATLFMTLLAAFDLLLCRYAGQEQVLVGTPIANRNRSETEGLIGFFVNTLVLRGDVRGNPSFSELLGRVRETALSAYAQQDLPFEKLVEELQPERDLSRSPLFQVMFVLQNAPGEALELEGLSLSRVGSAVETAKFELLLGLQEVGEEVAGSINYNRDLYEAETIGRLVASYERVLQAVVTDAEQRAWEIDLLSDAERRQVIQEWNATAREYAPALTLSELFEAQAARTPETVALSFEGTTLTYRELNERANQLAHDLQRRNVGPDVLVGILMHRSVEMLVAVLAIWKAGGAYVPLDPEYPDERLRFMVGDAGIELVVTQAKFASRLGDTVAQSISVDADSAEMGNESEENLPLMAGGANLAYIIYTSGSSGTPKGAMVTHGGVLNSLQWKQQRFELTEQDAFLLHTSLNFDPSVWEIFWPLMVGGRVVIAPAGMLESGAFLQYMIEHSVTCAYFVPSQLAMVVQEQRLSECRNLRYVISGGEKLPLDVLRDFQELSSAELIHSYGPTEVTVGATEWVCETGAERVLIGRPIGNTQAYVLDGHLGPLPVGVVGELYIGGVGVGRGYAGQAALTANRFVPDRFSGAVGARLYRTGDLVRYDAEGKLEFVGRVDQQVKLRGYRIELGEIEAVLRRHEQVSAAVVVLNEADGDKRLVAYVVSEAEAGALREYLQAQLPEYMVPAFFVALSDLPLLPNGKLNRRALPAPESMVLAETEFAAPRTATEELLAGLWARVLRVNRVGINDNFFALGGHSLLATQVIARVRDAFRQEIALRSLFEQPTVAGLAQIIEIAQREGDGLEAPPLISVSREEDLPLSFAQQRLWFLDQLEPGNSFYNIPAAVRLRGVLNVTALERTLSEVVRRHEALRTTFVAIDGKPRQVIKPYAPVVLPVFDVSELTAAEREAETQRLLSEEALQPFDLARGPLVRACLVRLQADEHVALVTMHHIISDGWSTGIFIREVAALYGAYVRGEESPLEELPIQYGDFAHWQRGWLQGEVLAAQLAYWREALADAPTMLELPTDRPRPREQTFNGAMVSLVVPEELTGQLKELSQRERVTLFMTLLAGFQSLLFRHSGQDDLVVGTPIANRRYRELEDLIGFFVNTLALRASSLATVTVSELLPRVREVTLGAYAHQDLPFEKLVEELQPERDLSRNPLFQVMFALQNAPKNALELPGLTLEGEGGESRTTRFDLECHLREEGQVLSGGFVYNTDLFDQTTIERLVVNYQTLLQSIVADATVAVASLRLLRAEEERQLVYEWNETWSEYPRGVVHELFAQQVERTPHRTAVVFDEVSLTFAELHQRSNLLASYLQSKGVGADTVVGVMLERSVEMLVAVLGVLKAGGAYLPLDPEYPRERLQFMLEDAAVRVLLTQEQLAGNTGADVEIIRLDTDWHALAEQAVDEDQHAEVASDNLAYVIYTSGSTGQPKGVAMTHRPLVNLLHWQMRRSTPAPRTLQFTSLSFDVSFQEIFATWCAGATLVLMREEARRDPEALWELLIRERIERLFLPFVALQQLAEASEHNNEFPSTLREVITAGEQLKITRHIRSLFAKLDGCTLDNQYGPSETHVVSALMLNSDVAAWPELPAIGRPIANAQLYLLDERLQVVPIGTPGELYIGGEAVARGYLNRAAVSADKFLPHPFMVDCSSRLYRTGDQARHLPDGNIEFLGRRDQQVKVRGYRIELGEVEAALRQQPKVREAVVVISPTASGDNRLIAYVLTEPETTLTMSALRSGLRELLPEYMIPVAFVLLAEFSLTASGKIDRRALQARQVGLEAGGESVQARTPAEEIVAAIWAEVLGRDVVGMHDNFFELGGHSLLATQVISRVRDAFRQEVPLRSLFELPTVAGLVQSIEQQQRAGAGLLAPPLVRITGAERLPLSFAQQRLWFLDQMEPGSSYNIPAAVRLRGVLNIEVLEQTLSEVVRRHEVLRTRFIAVDGEPVQVIDAAAPLRLEVLDLSALDEEAREADMLRMVHMEASLPFDLSRGPLLRVSLIRLSAEDHVASVTMHHIVTDGWSMAIFINEVATLYAAYVRGDESPLEELPIQYADFAHWQRGWLQGEVLAAQLDYWRAELADAPTVIDFPIDKPRPPVQTYRGTYQPLQLSTELSAQLRDLSRQNGSTLFMTLLAAFDLLLCRYAGQEQVLVGSPIANRNRSETEALIGFFVNTLVFRGDVRGNPSFRELLRRVRETALSAYAHQDLPFEKLVEELQPERDMSRSPLFQVTFTWQNAPSEALELEGLRLSGVEGAADTVKFEMSLVLEERGGAIVGAMVYNPDLFEATTIERLMASYERVLQAISANADQRVLEIDLLSETERQQIVEGWNETRREYRGAVTLHRLFEAQAARSGEAVALVFEGEQLSYAELDRRSNQLAHHLVALGVSPESLVAVCLDRSLELFIALLGILKAGAAYLPLDPSYPLERLSFMLADAGSPLLLTSESLADELPTQWTLPLLLDADWDLIAQNPDEPLAETVVAAEQLAYVMYTSGSTGTPKGVAVTHGGVVRLVTSPNYVRLDAEQTLLQLAPMTFDASTLEVWGALLNGGRLVVMPPNAPTLDEISQMIVDEGVTTLWLTAGLFHLMVEEQLEGLSQVDQLLAGGDVLSVRHVEKYLAAISHGERRLINGYGPTENTTFTCCHVMEGPTGLPGSVPIGRPITNTQVYVLDAEMQVAPVGVVGELYIGGAGLARGYFNQPERTAERFVPHPQSAEAGERLYRTGDLVRWHENGELEFIGRVDGQVKIRGFRIEVGELEAVLAAHGSVREAVVLVREDERGDKRLVAYVVKEVESEVSGGELKEYLRERLPEYMQVQWMVAVAELPLTANGKIDRRALQALAVEDEGSGEQRVGARTPTEEILLAIWGEVLGRERIGVHDNFFELGGHSLLATQVISRVRDAFGQEVALRSLFEQPTAAGLAREIEAGRLGTELQAPPLERVARAERLPLSFAQQRLWFLDQLKPGSSFYNIPAAVRLRGVLNVEALERTLSEVVRRHEVLRTHFSAVDGEPVQVIEAAAPIKLEVLDLTDLDEAERTAETERLVAEESARPFDLSRGPLLRVSLLRLQKDEHVTLVTMHHIVSDGWSIGVLVREVAALYSAYVRGEESPLEELAIQYADFAHWQRSWLEGAVLAAQLDYWRAELADAPTVIDLPIDKPRPPVQTHRGAYQSLQLSTELSAQLRDLSRRHGSTLFMTLLAAYDLLLCRYAGHEQVLVGTPIANRNRSETESLIGFFVNTLVLRGDVRGNPSFSELLRRVRETALGAYAHQDLPFEKLVEELQPERDMSRSPLFQAMFMLQNAPSEALELEGLSLSGLESAGDTVKFELTLGIQELGEMVVGGVSYNRDLYEAPTIKRLVASYERVLQAVVTDAEQRAWEIDLLSEAERRQLNEGWNETAAAYPRATLSELFEAQVTRTPEAVALLFEDTVLSYRELNERANQLARYLQCAGVGPEMLVGILMHRSVEMVVAVLGILKAGGAYVPLDPSYPRERVTFMVQDSGMGLLLTQRELRAQAPEFEVRMLALDEEWEQIAAQSIANPPVLTMSDNLAYVIYTSGSTGKPKGVQIQQRSLINFLTSMVQRPGLAASDVLLSVTSLSFDIAGLELFLPLLNGACVVVASREEVADGGLLRARLAASGATVMQATPATWSLLLEAGWPGDKGLQVLCGGEALGAKLARELAPRSRELWNLYGPTETTIWSSLSKVNGTSPVTLGVPVANTQFYVLDGQLQPVPIGVAGELYIAGDGLARGYLERPELTAEKFVANPFSTIVGARMYRTGDLVRYRCEGELEYLGRLDQQVKVRGFRIELGEIESVLGSHPEITENVVLVQQNKQGEKRLVAYIVGENKPASNELRGYLKERLPEYMVPQAFVSLPELPLTPNRKIDRRVLQAMKIEVERSEESLIGPRDMVELQLAHIWEELLDLRHVGVHDDFFSLGGHSLLAVRLMARIQASFGQHLPLAALFQRATVEKQASLLREQPHDHGTSVLVGIQPKGEGLPFFCVHPVGGNVLCYRELANHLGLERPFYGLQARGLNENQVPHTRIEEMAAHYLEAIRSVQADGPYLLGGWSMGGVVAYEMAQQMEAHGQQVSLLALMDARPVNAVEEAAQWDEITLLMNFARDLGLSLDGLQLSTDELAKLDSDELLSHVLQRAIEVGVVPGDIQLAHARRLFEVFKINVQAMQSYRPEASSTRVTLLRAGEQEVADETMGWGALTSGEIEIHRVPGNHFTIVREPYVRSLAEQLADCINRATLRSFASHT